MVVLAVTGFVEWVARWLGSQREVEGELFELLWLIVKNELSDKSRKTYSTATNHTVPIVIN